MGVSCLTICLLLSHRSNYLSTRLAALSSMLHPYTLLCVSLNDTHTHICICVQTSTVVAVSCLVLRCAVLNVTCAID